MPSTVVHVAVGALLAAALLGFAYDRRSLAVVLLAAALPDLDTLLGVYVRGGHRALLHTGLLPAALVAALAYDRYGREESWLRARWGARGERTAWVAVAALAFAGVAPDLLTNGVNLFYPVHDEFFALDGHLLLSNQRGVVQTFVEFQRGGGQTSVGTTQTHHYSTGFDTRAGPDPKDVERVFPVVQSGTELLLVVLAVLASAVRLRDARRARD